MKRRSFLKHLISLPALAWTATPAMSAIDHTAQSPDRLIIVNGWVLKASDVTTLRRVSD